MIRLRSLVMLAVLAMVAGCSKSSPENDRRSATGEVLEGTTSDAMLPLGELSSQPPLLPASRAKTTPEGVADQQTGLADLTSAISSEQPTDQTSPAPAAAPSSNPP